MEKPSGTLIVVTGFPATGTGKTTLVEAVLARLTSSARVVTCTTRPMRQREVDGRDYHFLTKEDFQHECDTGNFLEFDQHYAHWYGTRKSDVEALLRLYHHVFLITDLAGAKTLQSLYPTSCFVAVTAGISDVRTFMSGRGDEEEKITKRLVPEQLAHEEANFRSIQYSIVIRNVPGKMDEVLRQLIGAVELHRSAELAFLRLSKT